MSAKQDDGMERWGSILQRLGMKNTETLAEWRDRTLNNAASTTPDKEKSYPYESVPLPQGVKPVCDERLKEILSGYEEFPAPDLFEIRSLAYEVRNHRMAVAKTKAESTYACSVCDWGGELPEFVSTTADSYRVACPKCGEQAEINPP